MGFHNQQWLQLAWSQHDSAHKQWLQQWLQRWLQLDLSQHDSAHQQALLRHEWLQQKFLCHAWLLQGWSSQAWETQKKKEEQKKLKSEPPNIASESSASPPQLLHPFIEDAMVNNPDKPTSTWFTASECKLVCALTLYIDTRENPPESIKKHGKRRDAHIDEMHDEILLYLRFIFGVPRISARVDSSGLYDYIKGSNHKPLRNLFIERREDKYGFWTARARATFQWWVMLRTPLRERVMTEDGFKKMPNGTCVRQDTTLEIYDDAKPILDVEYLATRHPRTYRYDIELMPIIQWVLDAEYLATRFPETNLYDVELMPITKWLVFISFKCVMFSPPPPPPTPYWPYNMILTENRQTQSEKPHSPQSHHTGGEQRKPAAKKPKRRRHNVPPTHIESPEHLPPADGVSLPISHPIGHQLRSKTVPPLPSLLHPSAHHQALGTAAESVQYPNMSYRCELRRRARSRH